MVKPQKSDEKRGKRSRTRQASDSDEEVPPHRIPSTSSNPHPRPPIRPWTGPSTIQMGSRPQQANMQFGDNHPPSGHVGPQVHQQGPIHIRHPMEHRLGFRSESLPGLQHGHHHGPHVGPFPGQNLPGYRYPGHQLPGNHPDNYFPTPPPSNQMEGPPQQANTPFGFNYLPEGHGHSQIHQQSPIHMGNYPAHPLGLHLGHHPNQVQHQHPGHQLPHHFFPMPYYAMPPLFQPHQHGVPLVYGFPQPPPPQPTRGFVNQDTSNQQGGSSDVTIPVGEFADSTVTPIITEIDDAEATRLLSEQDDDVLIEPLIELPDDTITLDEEDNENASEDEATDDNDFDEEESDDETTDEEVVFLHSTGSTKPPKDA